MVARRLSFLLVLVALFPAAAAADGVHTVRAADAPLSLAVGQARFWPGGHIESGSVDDPVLCDVVAPCPTWPLELAEGGRRLRVAIDTPSREDSFDVELLDPTGAVKATGSASNQFNGEAFAERPDAGRWTVRVVPRGATDASFRMRARLEGALPPAGEKHPLLPNLRAVPPYEFGFVAPANPLNAAYPPDTVNPPLEVAGVAPLSCTADEVAPVELQGGAAKECLRLTSGPINVGDGPFLKRFAFAGDLAAGTADVETLRGTARQEVLWSDGTSTQRDAGTYSFHTTHAHFHDDGILTYELFRLVGGRDGSELVAAGQGTKSGFCPADQLIGDWRSFTQDPPGAFGEGDQPGGSCFDPQDGTFALTRGWGDVYRYQRPGQYVEFAGNGDGHYVVRTTVDKSNTTLETDEQDNSAYALIKITGKRVDIVERGWGTSHLDPARKVFTGLGPAAQDDVAGELPATGAAPPADTSAPTLSVVSLRRGVLRFRLSERASVTLVARRKGRTVARMALSGRRGINAVRLPARARRKGTRLTLFARDGAGNTTKALRRTL